MFSTVWRFIRRHKGKIVLLGMVSGGVLYAVRRFSVAGQIQSLFSLTQNSADQDLEYLDAMDAMRKQEFFEIMITNSDVTTAAILSDAQLELIQFNNVEALKEALKALREPSQPPHTAAQSAELWRQLKIASVCRLFTGMYFTIYAHLTVRMQWSILAGTLYGQRENSHSVLTENVKIAYVSATSAVLQMLLSPIQDCVKAVCEEIVLKMSLKQCLSLKQLDQLFLRLRKRIEVTKLRPDFLHNAHTIQAMEQLPPASQHRLRQLLEDTQEIINSYDFTGVLTACCDCAFLSLQECLAETVYQKSRILPDAGVALAKLLPHFTAAVDDLLSQKSWPHAVTTGSSAPAAVPPTQAAGIRQVHCNIASCQVLRCFASNIFESFCVQPCL